jgi:hypothetical protein
MELPSPTEFAGYNFGWLADGGIIFGANDNYYGF